MNIKCKIFPDESKEFPWDKNALEIFKRKIIENHIESRMDDIFLLGFLRARKFDQQRAFQLLKNYHSRRLEYPEYFDNLLPSKLEHILSQKCVQYLPQPDQKGRYICISQSGGWDPSTSTTIDFFRTHLLFHDFMLNFHRAQENRIVVILNEAGITLRHFFAWSPRIVTSALAILSQDSYQLRFQEMHFVNINAMVKAMIDIFMPLLPTKIKERIHLHSDMTTLHKFIHPQYLPAEFGGELPNFDPTEANEMIRENEDFFRMNEEYLKLYKEATERNFNEGRFRYVDQDKIDEKYEQLLKETETKFKQISEDPESYLSYIEKNPEFNITHL